MLSYRVCFLNDIPWFDKLVQSCQRAILIRSARSPGRPIEAAKKRFARLEGIRDWRLHAGRLDIESIELDTAGAAAPLAKSLSG
jgi:hypothetical protein